MRLIVARCEVTYSGRLSAVLPEAVRLLILKGDGSVLVHDDAGGYKPLNWMTAPTFIADEGDRLVVTKPKSEDALEIRLLDVLSDVVNEYVSLERAENEYGVVIDAATMTVDMEATAARRSAAK